MPGDTIAAISTSLGPGAIAVVRLSGPRALEVGDAVFRGAGALSACTSHTVHHGHVVDRTGREMDEVLATVLLAPHTYTTEHMIEFGCHGGAMPARRVLAACLEAGARQARPGEFTERAFLGGRLDLVQAEAVADIVAARTPRGLELALGQLEGRLSGKLAALRETVLAARSEVEAALDFSEDVDGASAMASAGALATEAAVQAAGLLKNCERGIAVRDGVSVALVGRPNVGKSSLMNALLVRDRSIVTPSPGTTRDTIEELLDLEGVPVRLIDTAGWRETREEAERAGVRRARAAAEGAAVVVHVLDASEPLADEDREIGRVLAGRAAVVAANKSDLEQAFGVSDVTRLYALSGDGPRSGGTGRAAEPTVVSVSALTGAGLDVLRRALWGACTSTESGTEPSVTNVRHVHSLRRVQAALRRGAQLVERAAPGELVAAELAQAADALGEITGETTPEDVLEHIFARFCVGK